MAKDQKKSAVGQMYRSQEIIRAAAERLCYGRFKTVKDEKMNFTKTTRTAGRTSVVGFLREAGDSA